MNPANVVTVARIAIVPFFAWALLVYNGQSVGWRFAAAAIFFAAALTDNIDGYLARTRNWITDLGKLLDPIADKSLVGTALVLLAWPLHELPWWVPTVILAREFGVTAMRMALKKKYVLPASRGGKLKATLQVLAATLFLLPHQVLPNWIGHVAWVLMGVAIAVTVVTGIDYAIKGWRISRADSVPAPVVDEQSEESVVGDSGNDIGGVT